MAKIDSKKKTGSKKKSTIQKSRLMPLAGMFVLIAAVVVILFSGTSGFSAANINQHLQRFADYVSQHAAAAGKDGKFTYGTPDIEGWGFNKHATVENVSLDVAEKSSPDTARWSFSTAKMLIIPDPASAGGLAFVFPGPINVTENGQPKTTVTFPSPLKYVYSDAEENHAHAIAHILHLPSQMTFTAAGGENGSFVITYDENPLLHMKNMPDSNQSEAAYEFRNVTLTAADGMQVTAASVLSHFNEAPGKDNHLEGKYTFKVSNLVLHNHDKISKAYSVNVDLSSSDTRPATGNMETTINEMLLSTDGFTVKMTGSIASAPDDSFPFGNAALDIDNVPQFLASDVMPEQARKILAGALQKVTGQPVETLTHAAIPLKRDKNGTLYVGDITFQTLLASVFTDMMQAPSAGTQQQQPPAANPEMPATPPAAGVPSSNSVPTKPSM